MPAPAANEFEIGVFPTPEDAHYAIQDLLANGVSRESILCAVNDLPVGPDHEHSIALPATLFGLFEGAVYGGILGMLVGLGAMFFIPTGSITISPSAVAVAGMALGAIVAGGATFWTGYHVARDEADYVAEGLTRAATVVSVRIDESSRDFVASILDRDGAIDVEMREADTPAESISSISVPGVQLSFHA
jgi:uncharacterized membrane protein